MSKRPFVFLALVLLAVFLLFQNKQMVQDLYLKRLAMVEEIPQIAQKTINTPPPLRAKQESPRAFLTLEGVVTHTNNQRAQHGLPPLSNNSLLNQSAFKKAQDMFNKQYFAHDSPDGKGVADLAEEVDYQFIAIGENLALGNFLNDAVLVQAWMDSPGHRANILNNRYIEMGVGVIKGTYEGKTTWMAVQHFGRPLSDCPQPNDSLLSRIEDNKNRLKQMGEDLERRKKELDEAEPKHGPEYNQKIDEYNSKVAEYNSLVNETKNLTEEYNAQTKAFNQCASN